jgi:hypothetical protein
MQRQVVHTGVTRNKEPSHLGSGRTVDHGITVPASLFHAQPASPVVSGNVYGGRRIDLFLPVPVYKIPQ